MQWFFLLLFSAQVKNQSNTTHQDREILNHEGWKYQLSNLLKIISQTTLLYKLRSQSLNRTSYLDQTQKPFLSVAYLKKKKKTLDLEIPALFFSVILFYCQLYK